MCTRDLVARGKRSAPAAAARRESSAKRCRGLAEVPPGVVPTPPAGAYERSLNSRPSLPRATGCALNRFRWRDYVPRPYP